MVLPLHKVPDQLRKKWQRRSEPMLYMKNKAQEQNNDIIINNNNNNDINKEEKHNKKDLNPDLYVYGIGDYQFISELGKGKFSKVMLAQHYLTGEKFAVKIIDKRSYDERILIRLIREIRIMEVLNHPNIVRIYETIETAYTIYMIMEYIPGGNLEEYLKKRGGNLTEQEARIIFRQMISAIDYCHRKWVVHRDIKAQNVLLTENNQIRIIDFGLSNRFGYHRLNTVCGSVLYYSPEMINRKRYIGPEIDCWCLGIFLYRILAGSEAFAHAKNEEQLRRDIMNRNYLTPEHFTEGLNHTIQKCLSTDRRKRSSLCNALQGDPWLNDYGRLGDLFTDQSNYHAAMYQFSAPSSTSNNNDQNSNNGMEDISLEIRQKEREKQQQQFLNDIEEEKRSIYPIRRNVIYHAYNKSDYYTTLGKRDDSNSLEAARFKLYQEIRSVLNQVSLEPINNINNITNVKSPVQNLFQKLRRSESHLSLSPLSPTLPSTNKNNLILLPSSSTSSLSSNSDEDSNSSQQPSSRRSSITSKLIKLSKKSSTLSLSQMYQKNKTINNNNSNNNNKKEKVYYFTIQSNVRAISSATILSINSSHTATTTLLDDHRVPTTEQPDQTQDEYELILLVRSICEILGVTYLHESKSKLCCMLTLKDVMSTSHHQIKKMSSTNTIGLHYSNGIMASSSPSNLFIKPNMTNHSLYPDSKEFNNDINDNQQQQPNRWLNKQLHKLSFTQLRHSNSVQHLNLKYASIEKEEQKQKHEYKNNQHEENIINFKELNGLALFIIEVNFVPTKQNESRLLALKFIKVSGSTRVFELATGWITRILSSKNDN